MVVFASSFRPTGAMALVPNRLGDCVSAIKTEGHREIKRIPVGIWPGGTVFSPDGDRAYVANNKTNDVSVVDVARLTVVDSVDVGIHPDGIAFARIGREN